MKSPQEWEFTNLLEIQRFYAEQYCNLAEHLHATAMQITLADSGSEERRLAKGVISTLVPHLREMQAKCESIGLEATADAISSAIDRWDRYHDLRLLMNQCMSIEQSLTSEFKRRVCFILPRASQKLYENPCESWGPVLGVFPDAQNDVEEMNKCMAFGRYPAAVFHVLLVVEHGLMALGSIIGVTDGKIGWDATCAKLESILKDGRNKAAPEIREHFAFLELMNKDIQSMKFAWRNKVNHAANHLFVMTSDFKPEVADKIIASCHGFMLLLATEGPRKKKRKK